MSAAITRDMPEDDYHADLSLSSTGARRLLDCPARYRWEADHPTPPTDAMKFGKAVHRHLLGTGAEIAVSDEWADFRTKAAQEWKAKVEATGATRHPGVLVGPEDRHLGVAPLRVEEAGV